MSRYDCIVVGLGPAGATVLRDLALSGIRAVGIDKAMFPRSKPCGGALSALAQKQLTVCGWQQLVIDSLHTVRLALRCGKEITHTTNAPICNFIMREQFDQFLVNAAANAGAEVRDGVNVTEVEVSATGVDVITKEERIHARYLVGCDGAHSTVARAVGLAQPAVGAAIEAEIEVSAAVAQEHTSEAYLSLATPAWGYGWVFPKGNMLSVGVGSFSSHNVHLRQALDHFLEMRGLQGLPMRVAGHLIPAGKPNRTLHKGPVILAGDAAGLLDPLSGEGIGYALMSGHLAARHVQACLAAQQADCSPYQAEISGTIGKELAYARWIAHKVYTFPGTFFHFLERSPISIELYCKLIAGEVTYREMVRHLKRQFLYFGILRSSKTENMPHEQA